MRDQDLIEAARGQAVLPYAKAIIESWSSLCVEDKRLIRDIAGVNFVASVNEMATAYDRAGVN